MAPWPAWVRYTLLTVLFAVVGVGLVVALYSRGLLPIAGPFAVIFLVPLLLALRRFGLRGRLRRLSRRTSEQLAALAPAIEQERRLAPQSRASRADDQSLDEAATHVESAIQRLAWGRESAATACVDALARTARDAWSPEAPLSRDVGRVTATAQELQKVLRQAGDNDA